MEKKILITKHVRTGTGEYLTISHDEKNLNELKETLKKVVKALEDYKGNFEAKSFIV